MTQLVECVPNFSEGRRKEVIDAIAKAISSTEGCTLLDVDPGPSTNRTVYTFVGAPEAVVNGALNGAKVASTLIDMRSHKGEHARLGALDVCPFIPIRGVTMDDCVKCAHNFSQRLVEMLNVPVFLYGFAAQKESRRSVPQNRAGEYEGLKQRLTQAEWRPDYGPAEFVPTWGATIAGARKFLVAYNINLLATKEQAHRIALNIREQGRSPQQPGRFKTVQAVGWYLQEHNLAQISCNLLDYEQVGMHQVFESINDDARDLKLAVAGSQIVGLIPLAALLDVAEFYEKRESLCILDQEQKVMLAVQRLGLSSLAPFNPREKVIEYILKIDTESAVDPCPGLEVGSKLQSLTVREFVSSVAARSAAPGGGSVAAVVGSLGAALATMVAQLTFGYKKFDHLDAKLRTLLPKLNSAYKQLLPYVDRDTAAFNSYMAALKTGDEKPSAKGSADANAKSGTGDSSGSSSSQSSASGEQDPVRIACIRCIEVPLSMARTISALWPTLRELVPLFNENCLSDMQVGVCCMETAISGAYYNVIINLRNFSDKDKDLKEKYAQEIVQIVKEARAEKQAILESLSKRSDLSLDVEKLY